MITNIIILVVSIFFVVMGAALFVKSSSSLARKIGVSEFVIGLTLIALGTSFPELLSSIFASLKGENGLVTGIILGANITNLTLIIGLSAVVSEINLNKEILKRDVLVMVSVVLLLGLFVLDRTLSRLEGGIFLIMFLGYNFYLFKSQHHKERKIRKVADQIGKNQRKKAILLDLVVLILGGLLLIFGAKYLVKEAIVISSTIGISVIILGIIISVGTTLPELSVGIQASRKKEGELAVGDSIGSVITNTLLILGVSAVIFPLNIGESAIKILIPFLFVTSIFLGIFIRSKFKLSRIEGTLLFLGYIIFLFVSLKFL